MNIWLKNTVLLVLMLAAYGLALALHPSLKVVDAQAKVDLESLIPENFADWREEREQSVLVVDPQQKNLIEKIYTQTLTRIYINSDGYRILLSLAYGDDQRDSMQLHRPEYCYPAQGFSLIDKQSAIIAADNDKIDVTRLLTRLGERNEPVTYWIRIGDYVIQSAIEKKIVEMRYGLEGKIADGMLFRISSIDTDTKRAYEIQSEFAAQLLEVVGPTRRKQLIGQRQ